MFFNIFCYFCICGLAFLSFLLVLTIEKLATKIKYFESVLSQIVEICDKTEAKVDGLEKKVTCLRQREYFQGLNSHKNK